MLRNARMIEGLRLHPVLRSVVCNLVLCDYFCQSSFSLAAKKQRLGGRIQAISNSCLTFFSGGVKSVLVVELSRVLEGILLEKRAAVVKKRWFVRGNNQKIAEMIAQG